MKFSVDPGILCKIHRVFRIHFITPLTVGRMHVCIIRLKYCVKDFSVRDTRDAVKAIFFFHFHSILTQ